MADPLPQTQLTRRQKESMRNRANQKEGEERREPPATMHATAERRS